MQIVLIVIIVLCLPILWLERRIFWVLFTIGVGAVLILTLDAVEKGNQKQTRRHEVIKRAIQEGRESVEKKVDATAEARNLQSESPVEVDEVPDRRLALVADYVESIDSFLKPVVGVQISRVVSVVEAARALRTELLVADGDWLHALREYSDCKVCSWKDFETMESVDGMRCMIIMSGLDFGHLAPRLMLSSSGRESAIAVLDECSLGKDFDDTLQGFYEEIAPMQVAYGVRLFYPVNRLKSEKFSRFLDYK